MLICIDNTDPGSQSTVTILLRQQKVVDSPLKAIVQIPLRLTIINLKTALCS